MKIKRGQFVDLILSKVGIPRRKHPGSYYLTKRELVTLNSYIDAILSKTTETPK